MAQDNPAGLAGRPYSAAPFRTTSKASPLDDGVVVASAQGTDGGQARLGRKEEEELPTSDEDEGGASKIMPPKMKATLQRRVARVKRTLAFQ